MDNSLEISLVEAAWLICEHNCQDEFETPCENCEYAVLAERRSRAKAKEIKPPVIV